MQGLKCNVTGATSTSPLAAAQAPVYCEDDKTKCVKGAKQMLVWHRTYPSMLYTYLCKINITIEAVGEDNIVTEGADSPGYNTKCGWETGMLTYGNSSPSKKCY